MRFQDGLYFLQLMKYGILQYAVIRPVYVFQPPLRSVHRPKRRTTLIAIVLNYLGLYCASSWSPRWGYIYACHLISNSACSNVFSALPNCIYFRHDSHVLPNPALPNGIQASGTPSTAIEDDFDQGGRLG